MVDFGLIPLVAMSPRATDIFSESLNPPKVLQSCDKHFRDWRGFAGVLGIGGEVNSFRTSSSDPIRAIFDILKAKEEKVTFDVLLKALETIDRWDVLDDATDILEKDGKVYLERLEKGNAPEIDISVENQMLTYDDLIRYEAGQPMQTYDAFLLYADEDAPFGDEVIENLEKNGNLLLCTKNRDLISRGERFESDVLMELISDRCTRLVVLFSPNFIKDPVNTFLMNFGQSMGLYERRRKIVPVVYQECDIPKQMFHTVMLHYSEGKNANFWERLKNCVRTVSPPAITADISIVECSPAITEASPAIPEACPESSPTIPEASPETDKEVPEKSEIESPGGKIETPERNDSLESSSKRVKKNGFFRFSKKKSIKQEESMVQLPSLTGLDDIEEGDSDKKAGKRKSRGVANKIKALVSRS